MDFEPPHVVYDASVLFPFHTAHILVFLAIVGAVRARWTQDIHVEWVERSLEKYSGLDRGSIQRRRDNMDAALPGALVEGYSQRIADIEFKDPDDRHVIAAALECGANSIVTRDKQHFTNETLAPFELGAIDPDDLLCDLLESQPDLVVAALERAKAALSRSRPDWDAYAEMLESTGLTKFADAVRGRYPNPTPG